MNPDVSRVDLSALVEASAAPVPATEHRDGHSQAGDFSTWGRMGGLETPSRYGRPWFALLGCRRWGRVSSEVLTRYRAERLATKGRVA